MNRLLLAVLLLGPVAAARAGDAPAAAAPADEAKAQRDAFKAELEAAEAAFKRDGGDKIEHRKKMRDLRKAHHDKIRALREKQREKRGVPGGRKDEKKPAKS